MFRRFAVTLTIMLFASQTASATIEQLQNYGVGTTNLITLLYGDQIAEAIQMVFVGQSQSATENTAGSASQSYTGILQQVGSADGDSALIAVDQVFSVVGGQSQFTAGQAGLTVSLQELLNNSVGSLIAGLN